LRSAEQRAPSLGSARRCAEHQLALAQITLSDHPHADAFVAWPTQKSGGQIVNHIHCRIGNCLRREWPIQLDETRRVVIARARIGAAFEDDQARVDARVGKPSLDLGFDNREDFEMAQEERLQTRPVIHVEPRVGSDKA